MTPDPASTTSPDWPAVSPRWLVPLVELGIANGVRTADQHLALLKVAAVLDCDPAAEALVGWVRQVSLSWQHKPCISCPDGVRTLLAVDDPSDVCGTCAEIARLDEIESRRPACRLCLRPIGDGTELRVDPGFRDQRVHAACLEAARPADHIVQGRWSR